MRGPWYSFQRGSVSPASHHPLHAPPCTPTPWVPGNVQAVSYTAHCLGPTRRQNAIRPSRFLPSLRPRSPCFAARCCVPSVLFSSSGCSGVARRPTSPVPRPSTGWMRRPRCKMPLPTRSSSPMRRRRGPSAASLGGSTRLKRWASTHCGSCPSIPSARSAARTTLGHSGRRFGSEERKRRSLPPK